MAPLVKDRNLKSSAIYFKTQQINKMQLKHINKDSVMLQNIKIPK